MTFPSVNIPSGVLEDDPTNARRLAFILSVLEAASGLVTRSALQNKLNTKLAREAGITSENSPRLLEQLESSGFVRTVKGPRSLRYELTAAGKEQFQSMRSLLPLPNGINPASNARVSSLRTQFLLLPFLQAPQQPLTDGEANKKLNKYAKGMLDLNAKTANWLRQELARDGLLTSIKTGRSFQFTLTSEGRIELGRLTFDDQIEEKFSFTGRELNELMEAARDAARQFHEPAAVNSEVANPTDAQLENVILAQFREQLRECYQTTGLVPIYVLREFVRNQYGAEFGRHEIFDEAVLRLWRGKQVALCPIADPSRVSTAQMQDAIPGVGETLFYLETIRDAAAV